MTFSAESPVLDLTEAATAASPESVDIVGSGQTHVATWGLRAPRPEDPEALRLSAAARRRESDQSSVQLHELLVSRDSAGLCEMLPTFGTATWDGPARFIAAADALGFRQLYHVSNPDWAGVSTSTRPLARVGRAPLDREALAVQSQLGWQLGQRTLFTGVTKLAPGTTMTLSDGQTRLDRFTAEAPSNELSLDAAVNQAAQILREYTEALLDDHPDAILQLTGGLDSRVLLSAISPARRHGLRTVTLGVPGTPDLKIAAELSARYGMRHEVLSLDGLDELDHNEAYSLCLDAASRLDGNADPLAYGGLAFVEARSEPGPRISGLGGEVARGFYYFGWSPTAPVTPARAGRLAAWRMFANDSVSVEALDPQFAQWAREFATDEVLKALTATGKPWLAATDELYLAHRMQRWGGVTETAVCLDRPVFNPMLDDRFIGIANRVRPGDKRNIRFLSRLQFALDEELAETPLDNRPPPSAFARTSAANSLRVAGSNAGKFGRKARQRLQHANRPPAGGEILAAKVVEHWRTDPSQLQPLSGLGIFAEPWLATLVDGNSVPTTSTVAFLINVLASHHAAQPPTCGRQSAEP